MNAQQRKFLIDKIKKQAKETIDALRKAEPDPPSLSTFLLFELMQDRLRLKPEAEILAVLKNRALSGKDNWMNTDYAFSSRNDGEIKFKAKQLFIIPDEYQKAYEEYERKRDETRNLINDTRTQADSLITRIQLASDKVLQKMINEVDDMGDISLMDTKLRFLSSGDISEKLLEK